MVARKKMISSKSERLVSVVIPTFNRAKVVVDAIESASKQTYGNIEIIVVDDGSCDNTEQIVKSYRCKAPVKFIKHGKNKGGSAARNTGIRAASGELVAFLDSDDRWEPENIERQVVAMQCDPKRYGACYTGVKVVNEKGEYQYERRPTLFGDMKYALLPLNSIGQTSCGMVRRDLLERIDGFDETLKSCQDWDLWIRLSKITDFAVVPESMLVYVATPNGRITTVGRNRLSGHLAMYRKHLREAYRQNGQARASFMFTMGDIFMQMGKPGYAKRMFMGALRGNRTSIRRMVCFGMAVCGFSPATYARVKAVAQRSGL